MACYICSRCNKFRDGDYIVYHSTRINDETEPQDTCDDCLGDLEAQHEAGTLKLREVDYQPHEQN